MSQLRCPECDRLWSTAAASPGERCGVRIAGRRWCDGRLVEHGFAEVVCIWCASIFRLPDVPRLSWPRYCDRECWQAAKNARNRARDAKRALVPSRVLQCRARNRKWAEANRNVVNRNPWLHAAPPMPPTLPLVSLDVHVEPRPKYPLQQRNMRGIHGGVTGLLATTLGLRHQRRLPTFATRVHADADMRVMVWNTPRAVELCDTTTQGLLFERPTLFHVEDAVEVASPVVTRRGRLRVRLRTETPVVISKDGHTRSCTRPDEQTILHSLSGNLIERFGLAHLRDDVRCEVADVRTEPVRVNIGAKYRWFDGWEGEVDLDVNALAMWLLLAAEKAGFGSRTAFGFGQIAVEEL